MECYMTELNLDDIPQPAGRIVAEWYEANEPTPYELLVRLTQALAGTLKLEDLEVTNGH